jgi:septal ring factor EnvC (AmiA/AmiB activator)
MAYRRQRRLRMGGDVMTENANTKTITLALVGLCAVIGIMSFIAIVNYTSATNAQNQANIQTTYLQSLVNKLQADKAALQDQINSQATQISGLQGQLTSLTQDNTDLAMQKDILLSSMSYFERQVIQQEIANANTVMPAGSGGARMR